MKLLKTYLHYVDDPTNTLAKLFKERGFKEALWGYFIATLSWVLFFNIGDSLSAFALFFKLAILFVAELTIGYFLAAICSLFLDFSNIKNSPAELFILIGTAGFIKGLLIAFALISATIPYAKLGYLAPFALLLVFGLQLGYLTRNVQRLYHTSIGKALTTWLFAVVPVTAAVVLLGIFFIWGIVLLF